MPLPSSVTMQLIPRSLRDWGNSTAPVPNSAAWLGLATFVRQHADRALPGQGREDGGEEVGRVRRALVEKEDFAGREGVREAAGHGGHIAAGGVEGAAGPGHEAETVADMMTASSFIIARAGPRRGRALSSAGARDRIPAGSGIP